MTTRACRINSFTREMVWRVRGSTATSPMVKRARGLVILKTFSPTPMTPASTRSAKGPFHDALFWFEMSLAIG